MVDDPNRKTPRQFQCRDYLWDSFEQLSSELECSIDYLINEAMRHYLRAQGRTGPAKTTAGGVEGRQSLSPPMAQQPRAPTPATVARPPAGMPSMPAARPPSMGAMPAGRPSMPGIPGQAAPMGGPMIPPLVTQGRPAPAMPAMPSLPQRQPTAPPMQAPAPMRAAPPMQMAPPQMAPPQMAAAPMAPPMMPQPAAPMMGGRANAPMAAALAPAGQRVLYAIYADQEVPVTKEEFFIGRGQKMCDLVIRDTNISRQHARVVLHNGQYWMIDNQSTNGVEFRGAKIQQKRIDEGDVFTICGHDVAFSYR